MTVGDWDMVAKIRAASEDPRMAEAIRKRDARATAVPKPDLGGCCTDCKKGVEDREAELAAKVGRKPIDAEIDFGEIVVELGDVVELSYRLADGFFRGEKLGIVAPTGTMVESIKIGGKLQFQRPIRALDFAPSTLGCGVKFDSMSASDEFDVSLRFSEGGAFRMVLWGKVAVAATRDPSAYRSTVKSLPPHRG